MTLGNLVALSQDNIKRMLAYSSIAHTGYILVGLAAYGAAPAGSAAEEAGLQAVLFYSVAYSFMNLGAFAVVAALQRRPGVTSQISTFAGLGRRAPLLGALMLLFLLSLTGIPPLAGFWAKWYVIQAALQVGGWLTIAGRARRAQRRHRRVLLPARRRVYMYMRDPADNARADHDRRADVDRAGHRGRGHDRHRPAPAGHRSPSSPWPSKPLARCSNSVRARRDRARETAAGAGSITIFRRFCPTASGSSSLQIVAR